MENRDSFKMTYSAGQQEEIRQIREKYVVRTEDKMARLRALDAGVGKKATAVSVIVGVIGALILGGGMSLVMTDFGKQLGSAAFPLGIAVGIVGIVTVAMAYPVYIRTLKREREKIAPQIIQLTNELMKR